VGMIEKRGRSIDLFAVRVVRLAISKLRDRDMGFGSVEKFLLSLINCWFCASYRKCLYVFFRVDRTLETNLNRKENEVRHKNKASSLLKRRT
jgi:hypothetical protein